MKKRIFGAIAVFVLGVAFLAVPNASAQSTNNFSISTFDIQYELSRDSEGRSVLKTTETISAEFPSFNQNHGLERVIPTSYDGHPVSLHIEEASNVGVSDEYSSDTNNNKNVLRIGNPDDYVHGKQTYRIVYTQRDVTRAFSDTGRDEWYWDTNGTQWKVPIGALTVSIKIDPDLAGQLTGSAFCYFGQQGSRDLCTLTEAAVGAYSLSASHLAAGENASVAFGFKPGTFAAYKMSIGEILFMIWGAVQLLTIPVMIGGIIGITILYNRRRNRTRETDPIVAEYIPPRDASVMVASQLVSVSGSAFTAQLIDLAVRHYISIVETRAKSTWKAAEYDIVITTDLAPLLAEEKEGIIDMFGHVPKVGERLAMKTLVSNVPYSMRTTDNLKKLTALIESTYGLREKNPAASKILYRWAIAFGIFALITLSIPVGLLAGLTALLGSVIRPLTDKGLALRRYVLGVDRYVKASETERLKFLQGPDTAQKVGYEVDPNNPGQLVKLYERVLPYAILFGREKEWATRLGGFYQEAGTSPDWYTGTTAFNAAVFASTIRSISTSTASSAGSDSSSGGSSGGGSSGGGGGGGGGGGW